MKKFKRQPIDTKKSQKVQVFKKFFSIFAKKMHPQTLVYIELFCIY